MFVLWCDKRCSYLFVQTVLIENFPGSVLCRQEHTVTFVVASTLLKYQFILRSYKDEWQIFRSFDLCCSCIGFSLAKGLIATEKGAFSLGLRIIFVDPLRFNCVASEKRLLKYHHMGQHCLCCENTSFFLTRFWRLVRNCEG